MQVEKVSRDQVVKNSFWKFLESIGIQVVQLVVTVILARLLGPDDYGLMTLVLVSVNFLSLFVSSSISSYLVYIRDIRKQVFLTALVSNVIVSFILFIILFAFADRIADYYNAPQLSSLLRVMSFVLPFNSVSAIYNSYAQKMSLFRTLFVRNMIALPTSGVFALIAAFYGLGVWALVIQQFAYSLLLCIIVVITIKVTVEGEWHFEKEQIVPMFRYGGMVLVTTFIAFVSDNLSDLLIGKRINAEQLGYYNRGHHFPSTISSVVNNVVAGVLFPAFASYNSELKELKVKFSKSIRILYNTVLPILSGMIACADPMVKAVLSEKWIGSIPIVQIICLYFCALPLLQTSSQITLAIGRLSLRTLGETIKMVTTIIALLCLIDYGIIAVAFARLLVNILLVIITLIINKIIIGYGFFDFLMDIYKPLIVGGIVFLCLYPLSMLSISPWIILMAQFVIGALIYFFCIYLFKIEELKDLFTLILAKF